MAGGFALISEEAIVMRQVGDTLVWLAMIAVVAAVIYFTPRVARYVRAQGSAHGAECVTCGAMDYDLHESSQFAQ
jgi:hypothetical protein